VLHAVQDGQEDIGQPETAENSDEMGICRRIFGMRLLMWVFLAPKCCPRKNLFWTRVIISILIALLKGVILKVRNCPSQILSGKDSQPNEIR
jgi:hypothetical protein